MLIPSENEEIEAQRAQVELLKGTGAQAGEVLREED